MRSSMILAMKSQLLLIFLFWNTLLIAQEPSSLSFQQIKENFSPSLYEEKQVTIRGFYYQTADGHHFLADQPNLKSCCVGSEKKKKEQIQLISAIAPKSTFKAITVRGDFNFDSDSKQIFLDNPSIVPDTNTSISQLTWIIAAITLFLLSIFFFKKLI